RGARRRARRRHRSAAGAARSRVRLADGGRAEKSAAAVGRSVAARDAGARLPDGRRHRAEAGGRVRRGAAAGGRGAGAARRARRRRLDGHRAVVGGRSGSDVREPASGRSRDRTMSDFTERISKLSPKKLALLAVTLQSKVEQLERASSEPIAIVGVGCHVPGGGRDPESFWSLLRDGVAAITEVPRDRWDVDACWSADPDAPGKMYTRHGGFLDAIDRFDPHFFGIAPREAVTLDPQQRLLLEVSWEALEHAGQPVAALAGSETGVFIGISGSDYLKLQTQQRDLAKLETYVGTGTATSVAAGRLSYVLGLHGPSMSIDTACSSSLVAVHVACQSLLAGECRLALAGGVNLMLGPEANVVLCKSRMLAPDGRCKT